jgi:hypothetical protein
MTDLTLDIFNHQFNINDNKVNIKCYENVIIKLKKYADELILINDNNFNIEFDNFTIVINSSKIEILYKKIINLKIEKISKNIENDFNDIINNIILDSSKNILSEKKPTTKEEIIEARKKAKIERIKKYGLVYFDTEIEYSAFAKNATNEIKSEILRLNNKLLKERYNLRCVLGNNCRPIQIENSSNILNVMFQNIKLFTSNEKMQKQINKAENKLFNICESKNITFNQLFKQINKRKRKCENRRPSGFCKPVKISLELKTFLGFNNNSNIELSRVDVFKRVDKYIKQYNLQKPVNKRIINPDKILAKLFGLKPTDELTYFNLQKYLSPHFIK